MPIELVTFPDRRLAVLVLPDPARRTLRLLFRYQSQFRAMCWLQVGGDGSLYLARRRKPSAPGVHAEGIADGRGGALAITWAEVERAQVENPKVSHHASGLLKAGSRRSMSISPRDVGEPTLFRTD